MKVLLIDETKNIKDFLVTTNTDSDIEFFTYEQNEPEHKLLDLCSSVHAVIYISTLKEKYYDHHNNLFKLFLDKYVESLNNCSIIYVGPSLQRLGTSEFSKVSREKELYLSNFSNIFKNNIHIIRTSNIFGRWCDERQCDYILEYCKKVIEDIPLNIEVEKSSEFNYIEDVKKELLDIVKGHLTLSETNSHKFSKTYYLTNTAIYELFKSFKNYDNNRETSLAYDSLISKLHNVYNDYMFKKNPIISVPFYNGDKNVHLVFNSKFSGKKLLIKLSKDDYVTDDHIKSSERIIFVSGCFVVETKDLKNNKVEQIHIDTEFVELLIPSEVVLNIKCISSSGVILRWIVPIAEDKDIE